MALSFFATINMLARYFALVKTSPKPPLLISVLRRSSSAEALRQKSGACQWAERIFDSAVKDGASPHEFPGARASLAGASVDAASFHKFPGEHILRSVTIALPREFLGRQNVSSRQERSSATCGAIAAPTA
jgi:hypothetical protein